MPDAGRRVLVVDDEEGLRALVAAYLTRLGYEVRSCSSARDALECFGNEPSACSLLIVDVQMPGTSGVALALRARALSPATPVLFTSGHAPDLVSLPPSLADGTRFLQKPFSPAQLAEAVRSLLEQ